MSSQQTQLSFPERLLIYRAPLFGGLVVANVLLGLFILVSNPVPPPGSASQPMLLVNEQKIQLLDELPTFETKALTDTVLANRTLTNNTATNLPEPAELHLATAPVALPDPTPAVKECRIWGPVTERDALAAELAQLQADGGSPEFVEAQINGEPDHLVYIDQIPSDDGGQLIVAELKARQLDAYLLSRGPREIVSVGVFSKPEGAKRQKELVTGLGFDVKIRELPRYKRILRLKGFAAPGSPLYDKSISSCSAFAQGA